MDLRKEVMRLAHAVPELRKQLVPVLRQSADRTADEEPDFGKGKILIGNRVRLRWAGPNGSGRDSESIIVEELPGKPHKTRLRRFVYTGDWMARKEYLHQFLAVNIMADAKITKSMNYDQMVAAITEATMAAAAGVDSFQQRLTFYETQVHFLEVQPSDYRPLEVTLKDGTRIEAKWGSFDIWSKGSTMHYEPDGDPHYTKLVHQSPGGARKLYKLLRADMERFQGMTWETCKALLDANKIGYRYQFSQWT